MRYTDFLDIVVAHGLDPEQVLSWIRTNRHLPAFADLIEEYNLERALYGNGTETKDKRSNNVIDIFYKRYRKYRDSGLNKISRPE